MASLGRLVVGLICVLYAELVKSQATTIVQSKLGDFHGLTTTESYEGKTYSLTKFLGIPYAKPPVGDLRFRKSEPIDKMDSPFYATTFGSQCIQFSTTYPGPQSEDCLYLNVYVPDAQPDSTKKYAVAIWIHGGGFTTGNGNVYDSSVLSTFGNVIVVTINYRLGVYGFLSTMDDNAPGNNAFWDQHMAFKWVHDNIGDFGGDNQSVTIFGESAGGISASRQGFITQNKGLFQRIIAQSGSVLMPIPPDVNAIEDAQRLGKYIGCDALPTTKDLMYCLRSKSNDEIVTAHMLYSIPPSNYGYVIDKVLIMEDPEFLLAQTDTKQIKELEFYRSLDVMNGFNIYDGFFLYQDFNAVDQFPLANLSREEMKTRIGVALQNSFGHLHESIIEMVLSEYTNWSNPFSMEESTLQLVKLYGDIIFGVPAIKSAHIHEQVSTSSRNYVYYFVADPTFHTTNTPEWLPGANHADEIMYVFGIEPFSAIFGFVPEQWETLLSQKIMRYWTNFMKSGNPNEPDEVSPWWPEYDTEYQHYIEFEPNTTQQSVQQYLHARETNFWYNVFPTVYEKVEKKPSACTDVTSSAYFVIPQIKLFGVLLAFVLNM